MTDPDNHKAYSLPGENRYCPCNGECHRAGLNPCSIDFFAHHDEISTREPRLMSDTDLRSDRKRGT